MSAAKPAIHGRDHLVGGADPLPLEEATAWGATIRTTTNTAAIGLDPITFTTVVDDTAEMADLGADNDRLTITRDGFYVVTLVVNWGTFIDTGKTKGISIMQNGVVVVPSGQSGSQSSTADYAVTNNASVILELVEGDYIGGQTFHDLAGSRNTFARLSVFRLDGGFVSGGTSVGGGGGGAPSGPAGGVLSGTYPDPGFAADMATQAELDAHTGDTSAAHAASAVSADSTTLVGTGTDVQAVLEELDNGIADHLADTTDAHDASAISADSTTLVGTATDVQGVLEELDNAIAGIGGGGGNFVASDIIWDAKGDLAGGTGTDAAAKLAVGSDYSALRGLASATTGMAWMPGAPVLLYDYTVAGSDKASIDTGADTPDAGIAGTSAFQALQILEVWLIAQGDNVSPTVDVAIDLTINNDTGGNYDNAAISSVGGGAVGAASAVAQTGWALNTHGQGGSTQYPSIHRLTIPGYAQTTFYKVAEYTEAREDTTAGNSRVAIRTMGWRNTAAVTRLKIAARTTTKLKVGSRLIVYGR